MRYPKAGTKVCPRHGGHAPQVVAAGLRRVRDEQARAAVATYGLPREVEPAQALLEEVHRAAGHVAWLAALVADLDRSELKQLDTSERFEKPSVWVELYGQERDRLARVAKSAHDAGISEQEIQLAQRHSDLLAAVLRRVFDRLGIDSAPGTPAAAAVLEELRALTAGSAA